MVQRINFAKMWDFDLPQYAEAGYQRAQYFLGRAFLERGSFHDITDDPQKLQLAEQWLKAAINNPGIDPDDTKQRKDRKKYIDLAKDALSKKYTGLARKNAVFSGDPYNPQYNEVGLENIVKAVELGVDPYFISWVAAQYLRGGIPHLGEGNTGERGKKFAISLLVNSAKIERTESDWYLHEIAKETGGLDIRAAEGHAKIFKSYERLDEHWEYKQIFEEGFKIIEDVGSHDKNGYEGYKQAKAVLDSLEQRAKELQIAEEKHFLRTRRPQAVLESASGTVKKAEQSPLLQRIIKARQFIETSKMGSDAEFDARPA